MSKKTTRQKIYDLVLAAMFLAIGIVLPIFTGQIPQIGKMLLPMHLPVLLCGLICGWQYGGTVGFVLPILRYAMFGMPPMPNGLAMAFELAAYGMVAGLIYSRSRWQCVISLYRSLLIAMMGGRLVWAAVLVVMAGNIPLVGFFDLLCVVAAGHRCLVKPSSKDRVLTEYVLEQLRAIDPAVALSFYDEGAPVDGRRVATRSTDIVLAHPVKAGDLDPAYGGLALAQDNDGMEQEGVAENLNTLGDQACLTHHVGAVDDAGGGDPALEPLQGF